MSVDPTSAGSDANGTAAASVDPSVYVQDGSILVGISRQGREISPEMIELRLANRHGLITGATGTGKTVTLQVLAEGFSAAGVPVFAADIKGDLAGIATMGTPKPVLVERAKEMGLNA
ncbi:MAG: helicase HerA-like domain-containing protein, partial [Hyphomicrobiaceae bacterium]